jgi:Flp pilus assembly pilin Flp
MKARATLPRRVEQEGQSLAEYALILALIAIVAIGALLFLGVQLSDLLSQIGTALGTAF